MHYEVGCTCSSGKHITRRTYDGVPATWTKVVRALDRLPALDSTFKFKGNHVNLLVPEQSRDERETKFP